MSKYEKKRLIALFIREIDGKICDMMIDKYGNYTYQKFIEAANPHQVLDLIKAIREPDSNIKVSAIDACLDTRGTHCM